MSKKIQISLTYNNKTLSERETSASKKILGSLDMEWLTLRIKSTGTIRNEVTSEFLEHNLYSIKENYRIVLIQSTIYTIYTICTRKHHRPTQFSNKHTSQSNKKSRYGNDT